jgi:tryptophan synthase alpha chain
VSRLEETFRRLRAAGEIGLFPYLMAGFPALGADREILRALVAGGADGLEIGIPFSDPLADGATLQRASARALAAGARVGRAFELVGDLRPAWDGPVVLMSYLNPVLAYGVERFCQEAARAGADGLIVPDLPPEEAEPVESACRAAGLHYIFLLAPTSTPERIETVARRAAGFIYGVALVGVTGARQTLDPALVPFLARVRAVCPQPLVVGFGISRPEQVQALRGHADGVIVASVLADLIEERDAGAPVAVREYVQRLKAATRPLTAADRR